MLNVQCEAVHQAVVAGLYVQVVCQFVLYSNLMRGALVPWQLLPQFWLHKVLLQILPAAEQS